MLQLLFLLAFPLLVAAGVSLLTWNALSGPWKFAVLCTVALYGVYVLCFYFLAPTSVGFAVHAVEPGQPKVDEPLFVYLEPYYKPLAVFSIASIPVVLGLLRLFKH
jgi:hypothetical protein